MIEERYDIVIVGGGHNGTTAAAYLSKCGLSVCVLEEKYEAGGACDSVEPIAGVNIHPNAMLMYAAPSPGFEQLELWKYGFRMTWNPVETVGHATNGLTTTEGVTGLSPKDIEGYLKVSGIFGNPPFVRKLLRSIFWCPPHPPYVPINADTIPYMQVYKQHDPDIWTPDILNMTLFDFMDEWLETEPWKCTVASAAWWSGAAAHWDGVAIPALGGVLLAFLSAISVPRGGMHGYFHAIYRCAVDHGATFKSTCPVEEIIIRNGRAIGVRLREDATTREKKIWADKAVISAIDIKTTFNKLIGPYHIDRGTMQKINDLSVKGGTMWVSQFQLKKPLSWKAKFKSMARESNRIPYGTAYPVDSRDIYFENVRDVDAYKGRPSVPSERYLWFQTPSQAFDITDCQYPGNHCKGVVTAAFESGVTPPEYHVEGADSYDKTKGKMEVFLRKAFSHVFEGLEDDNIIHHWSSTPYEAQYRNPGLIGRSWCGIRHCDDQWWANRPLPELARYRTPIEGLYLCHQTSGHPGGLCLMAIPYNLMHILIEDGIAEPGDWWYPSPWYIPERGKISAIPTSK
jgi:phytoene dehydrogenase-like protein